MKKRLLNLLLVILLLVTIPGSLILASDITGALYKMGITISNNGTLANYVSTVGNISTPNLISGNYSNAAVDNVAVQDVGSNDVIFMPGHTTNPWVFWVETIGADSYVNYNLYTAESTDGTIAYFPDTTGMIVSDNSTLELGSDFEIETLGWVDTDAGADKNLVFKDDAFRTFIDGASNITSSIDDEGVVPVVVTVNGGNDVINQLNHTVNLPAGIEAGDLLLAFFASDGIAVITFPGGWIELFQDTDALNSVTMGAWYRVADGAEGATITVTTSAIQMTAHTTYRITDYAGIPEVGAFVDGNSANPDPPNLVPSWGTLNTLWFALEGNGGDRTVNAYPANYTNGRNDVAADALGCGIGSARRGLRAANENPGAFTLSAGIPWGANTIAIAPADLEVTATSIASDEYTVKTYGVANEPAWATGDVLHFPIGATSNINSGAIHNAAPKLWVSLWFKLDADFSAGDATQYVITKRIDGFDYLTLRLQGATGQLQWFHVVGTNPVLVVDSTETSWNAGQWYHAIASLSDDGLIQTDARLIVEGGTPVTDTDAGQNPAPNGGNFVIGDRSVGNGLGFGGVIANVIVGTDDLTVPEEAALYAGIAPGDETNYWYIDEGTGTGAGAVVDYGTGGNAGNVGVACTWQTSTFTTGSTGRLTDFYIEVDDGVLDPDRWGANLKGATVPDNANDWEFFLNDAMPYVKSLDMTVSGVTHGSYDLTKYLPTSNVIDRSYYGLEFDGDQDYVVGGNDSSLDFTDGDFTISLWMQVSDATGLRCIIERGISNASGYMFAVQTNNALYFYTSQAAVAQSTFTPAGSIVVDTWYMITVVREGADVTIYRNITDITVTPGVHIDPITNNENFDIGIRNDLTSWDFGGIMDGIQVYDRALQLAEITANYNAGVGNYTPNDSSNLVGQWHIEEGSGAATADTSGEGNNGTITGATWVNGKVPRPVDSSGTNDGTASFRTTSSDADVIATAVSFVPIEEAKAPTWTLDTTVATWVTAPVITGNFTTDPGPTYPGASVISDIAAASGTPAQLPFTILFGFLVLALSLIVTYLMRQSSAGSLLVKFLVIAFAMWIGIVLNVIDFWMLLFFIFPALAILAASKQGALI